MLPLNMWRLAVIFVLCFVDISLSSRLYQPIAARQAIEPRETKSCEGRQSPGPICESCDLLSTCVKHSDGWVNIPVETCDTQNGFYCNAHLGMCSNATGPCHPFSFEGNFPCTSHGIFPDPYDCQKYHMCYFVGPALVSASIDCGGDKAFNPATGQCSLTITHSVCQDKQFTCKNSGDAHVWPMSANIFYICKATSNQDERVLYPTLYRCDDGEIFDGYFCRAAQSNGLTASASNPAQTASTVAPEMKTSTLAPSGMDESRLCTGVGLFADKQDCRKYYYCSAISGNLKHIDCPAGTYFNDPISACTLGSC